MHKNANGYDSMTEWIEWMDDYLIKIKKRKASDYQCI